MRCHRLLFLVGALLLLARPLAVAQGEDEPTWEEPSGVWSMATAVQQQHQQEEGEEECLPSGFAAGPLPRTSEGGIESDTETETEPEDETAEQTTTTTWWVGNFKTRVLPVAAVTGLTATLLPTTLVQGMGMDTDRSMPRIDWSDNQKDPNGRVLPILPQFSSTQSKTYFTHHKPTPDVGTWASTAYGKATDYVTTTAAFVDGASIGVWLLCGDGESLHA
jgi:hypothetical protein